MSHARPSARVVVVAAVVGLALLVIGVVVGRATSPAEVAARRQPPAERAATAEVRQQRLRDVRVGTCELTAQGTRKVTFTGTPAGIDAPVVTAVDIGIGATIEAGRRLVEVSGRPVIGLPLPFPLYRDLTPGASGPDVRAVQTALADLGLLGEHDDGVYDRATERAVEDLYERVGAPAPTTGPEAQGALDAARAAEDELLTSAEAGEPVTAEQREAAADAVRSALAAVGTVVARAEIVQVEVGATVTAVAVAVGSPAAAEAEILTTAGSGVATSCTFEPAALEVGAADMEAELVLTGDVRVAGRLGDVQTNDDGDLVGSFVAGPDPVPPDRGSSGQVEVVVAQTEGEVVSVPVGALREQPDGTLAVAVTGEGDPSVREIEVGLVAGGWAEVLAGDVAVGDHVVVTADS